MDKKKVGFEKSWLKLDNAALIYPSASNDKWINIFRVSAYLKAEVVPAKLQQALNIVIERFPNFDVTRRHGIFWYYFENMTQFPIVEQEKSYPCAKMELRKKKHLFRVLYYKNKISFETFHALTDGSGALSFLNALVACYFELSGEKISIEELSVSYKDKPSPEELEDSFRQIADNSGTNKRESKISYQVTGTPEPAGVLDVINIVTSTNQLHSLAKKYDCTITELLTAIYAKSIIKNQKKSAYAKNRPVVVSVPVNLRKFFGSNTLRNFSSWINVSYNKNQKLDDLQDYINVCKNQMREKKKDYFVKNVNANIKSEKNIFVRLMPLFVKNIALHLVYKLYGEKTYTTVLTNLGKVCVPHEFDNLVDRYECVLCKSMMNAINIGVVSFGDKISITFSGCIKEHLIERDFCRTLTDLGLSLQINSNIK